jgi:hypothetical protein
MLPDGPEQQEHFTAEDAEERGGLQDKVHPMDISLHIVLYGMNDERQQTAWKRTEEAGNGGSPSDGRGSVRNGQPRNPKRANTLGFTGRSGGAGAFLVCLIRPFLPLPCVSAQSVFCCSATCLSGGSVYSVAPAF